jgi:hypothetical protein
MSAYSADKKTLAYQLGEALWRDDGPLPADDGHAPQGRPGKLLPLPGAARPDVYGDVKSLEEAMRRTRGALLPAPSRRRSSPSPTPRRAGQEALHQRKVQTHRSSSTRRMDFYDALTRYVEDQSIKAPPTIRPPPAPSASPWRCSSAASRPASTPSAAAWSACGQAREDPGRPRGLPAGADRPPPARRLRRPARRRTAGHHFRAGGGGARRRPGALREEIPPVQAHRPGPRRSKSARSKPSSSSSRRSSPSRVIFADPKMKLLIFTEHKDTLDYLAGDGKDGRPLGKLREWGLA